MGEFSVDFDSLRVVFDNEVIQFPNRESMEEFLAESMKTALALKVQNSLLFNRIKRESFETSMN